MRPGWTLFLAFVLGAGLWFLVLGPSDGNERPDAPAGTSPGEAGAPGRPRALGSLTVRVRAPDGSVPAGAEVGYAFGGQTRYAPVDRRTGKHLFADAPVGSLEVLARAPGFEPASQPRPLTEGVPETVVITLKPVRPGGQ